MHAFVPFLCALLPIARGEFESWDMHGASSLPPRHYLDAFSQPHVLRRVCLRRGGCAGGVALSDAEVAGLPLEDVVFGDGHVRQTYFEQHRPLAAVRGLWEKPDIEVKRQAEKATQRRLEQAAKQRPSLLSPRNRRLARGERRKKLAEKTTTGADVLLGGARPCYVSAASNWTTTKYLGETLDLAVLGERPNAWVGRASTAAAHYDAAVNYFAVVRGSKRFFVAPPGTVEDERSYLHPHFRRSRSLAAADDATVVEAGFEAVDLDAGDVLVLPAYWWHQVSTVDGFSISVNAWRRPPPVEKAMALAKRPDDVLPFGANWARGDTIAVLERLLETLVAGVLSDVDARAWLRRKLEHRLGDLPGMYPKLLTGATARHCAPANRAARAARAAALWDAPAIAPRVARAAGILRGLDDPRVRAVELGNAVEAVAQAALAPERNATEFAPGIFECRARRSARPAVAFLLSCFRDDERAAPAAADASFEDEDAGFEDEDAGFEDERWNATPADAAVGAAPAAVGRVAMASEL